MAAVIYQDITASEWKAAFIAHIVKRLKPNESHMREAGQDAQWLYERMEAQNNIDWSMDAVEAADMELQWSHEYESGTEGKHG